MKTRNRMLNEKIRAEQIRREGLHYNKQSGNKPKQRRNSPPHDPYDTVGLPQSSPFFNEPSIEPFLLILIPVIAAGKTRSWAGFFLGILLLTNYVHSHPIQASHPNKELLCEHNSSLPQQGQQHDLTPSETTSVAFADHQMKIPTSPVATQIPTQSQIDYWITKEMIGEIIIPDTSKHEWEQITLTNVVKSHSAITIVFESLFAQKLDKENYLPVKHMVDWIEKNYPDLKNTPIFLYYKTNVYFADALATNDERSYDIAKEACEMAYQSVHTVQIAEKIIDIYIYIHGLFFQSFPYIDKQWLLTTKRSLPTFSESYYILAHQALELLSIDAPEDTWLPLAQRAVSIFENGGKKFVEDQNIYEAYKVISTYYYKQSDFETALSYLEKGVPYLSYATPDERSKYTESITSLINTLPPKSKRVSSSAKANDMSIMPLETSFTPSEHTNDILINMALFGTFITSLSVLGAIGCLRRKSHEEKRTHIDQLHENIAQLIEPFLISFFSHFKKTTLDTFLIYTCDPTAFKTVVDPSIFQNPTESSIISSDKITISIENFKEICFQVFKGRNLRFKTDENNGLIFKIKGLENIKPLLQAIRNIMTEIQKFPHEYQPASQEVDMHHKRNAITVTDKDKQLRTLKTDMTNQLKILEQTIMTLTWTIQQQMAQIEKSPKQKSTIQAGRTALNELEWLLTDIKSYNTQIEKENPPDGNIMGNPPHKEQFQEKLLKTREQALQTLQTQTGIFAQRFHFLQQQIEEQFNKPFQEFKKQQHDLTQKLKSEISQKNTSIRAVQGQINRHIQDFEKKLSQFKQSKKNYTSQLEEHRKLPIQRSEIQTIQETYDQMTQLIKNIEFSETLLQIYQSLYSQSNYNRTDISSLTIEALQKQCDDVNRTQRELQALLERFENFQTKQCQPKFTQLQQLDDTIQNLLNTIKETEKKRIESKQDFPSFYSHSVELPPKQPIKDHFPPKKKKKKKPNKQQLPFFLQLTETVPQAPKDPWTSMNTPKPYQS
jgi:hypothetical protein